MQDGHAGTSPRTDGCQASTRRSTARATEVDQHAEQAGDHDQRVHRRRRRRWSARRAISLPRPGRADDQFGGDRRGSARPSAASRTPVIDVRQRGRPDHVPDPRPAAEAVGCGRCRRRPGRRRRRRTAPGPAPARTTRRRPAAASTRCSVPYSSTASGISATDGIGRRNSIVEAVNSRGKRELPISMPSTTPATTAMARPERPALQGVADRRPERGRRDLVDEGLADLRRRREVLPAAGSPSRGRISTSTTRRQQAGQAEQRRRQPAPPAAPAARRRHRRPGR